MRSYDILGCGICEQNEHPVYVLYENKIEFMFSILLCRRARNGTCARNITRGCIKNILEESLLELPSG